MYQNKDIAIIGMSGLFPGAKNIQQYWHNINHKIYSISEAPDEWSEPYFDPDSQPRQDLARIYTRQVGLLADVAEFNPLEFGIPPTAVGGDPSHFLALKTAKEALKDANYLTRPFNRERTGIILGRGSNPNRGDVTGIQYGVVSDQTIAIISQLHPELTSKDLKQLRQQLNNSLPDFPIEKAPTLVSNIASGRIANRLDLMGPNYLIDAACASALISVQLAMQELLSDRSDMMLAGGIQASMTPPIYQLFCHLNALSRDKIQPFSKNANGTLLGEGAGFLVLKRLTDAQKDGDRIYAVIKDIGVASDGKALGLLAPRLEGEILAIQRAYEQTGIDCQTLDLIEAHGTGIPLGDQTEIQALTKVFGERSGNLPKIALGSVKSMIGHCIPASGIASLLKMALSLHYKILPPTLCDEINPELKLEATPFYINTESRPWIHASDSPRRGGVNAFGFGGINSHAILEEYQPATKINSATKLPLSFSPAPVIKQWSWELILFSGETPLDLVNLVEKVTKYISIHPQTTLADLGYTLASEINPQHNYRLAVVANNLNHLKNKINLFVQHLQNQKTLSSLNRQGIFYSEQAQDLGKIAFVFSSEGAQYTNMLQDVSLCFPQVRQWFDLLDETFPRNNPPSHFIFPAPTALNNQQRQWQENQLYAGDLATESLFAASLGLYELLCDLGIQSDVMLGHSAGEHTIGTASYLCQIKSRKELSSNLGKLNHIYQELAKKEAIPTGVVFSVGGLSQQTIDNLFNSYPDSLFLVADNCPNQLLLFATHEASTEILKRIRELGGIYMIQPFNRAYHTPLFAKCATTLQSFYQNLNLRANWENTKLYSCATTEPYPEELDAIRDLVLKQWFLPVRFRETITKLYQQGVKTFIEVGANDHLTVFINNILRGEKYQAWATNKQRESGLKTIFSLLAKLFINGYPLKIDRLYQHRQLTCLNLNNLKPNSAKTSPILNLLLPKMELKSEFAQQIREKLKAQTILHQAQSPELESLDDSLTSQSNTNIKPVTHHDNSQSKTQISELDSPIDQDLSASIVQGHFKLMQDFLSNQAEISSMIFDDD